MNSCAVCGLDEAEHEKLNHEFSEFDSFPKPKKQKVVNDAVHIASSKPDFILRLFLMHKGIIDAGELEEFERVIRSGLTSLPSTSSTDTDGQDGS